jgi:RimJ/RimL family protein N-acetyltransferase
MLRPPETIETERLLLRPPRHSDARAIFEGYAQDTEVVRYLVWRPHEDLRETEQFLARCATGWQTGEEFPWAITIRDGGGPTGRAGAAGGETGETGGEVGGLTGAGGKLIGKAGELIGGSDKLIGAGGELIGEGCELVGESGELIGMVGLRVRDFKAEVGYVLARRWWGRGLVAEALRPVVAWALGQPAVYRVWAVCDVENRASARVMEKVGMEREGLLRRYTLRPNASAEPRDSYCYSVVK